MANSLHSQTYVNRDWVQVYGAPDTIEWSASTTDASGEIITVGNTLDTAQHANVLVTKIDWLGMIAWQVQWDGAQSGADYGAAVMTDVNSNIYVATASQYGNDSTYDIVLLKYNSSGTLLWEESFDGTGGDDYPVKMARDKAGHLYITGASEDTTGDLDYITLKYDTSGNFSWSARYDYHILTDIAADIVSDSAGSVIIVTGGSEDSASVWDYTTVLYNGSGTQIGVDRQSSGEADMKKPKDLVRDADKNYYITGVDFDSTNYDIKLVKLDSTLNPVWVQVFDQGNEGSHSLAIDDSANLYVGGWQDGDGTSRHFLLIKYDSSGNQIWYRTLWPDANKPIAEITKVRMGDNFTINVTGFAANAGNSDVVTAQYSTGGNFRWMRSWENMAGSIEFPTGVESQGDTVVYVSGRTQDSTGLKWVVMKYSIWVKDQPIAYCDSVPCALDDELLIRFHPDSLILSNVDNLDITWGRVSDFVSAGCLAAIADSMEDDLSNLICYKVFPNHLSTDTFVISAISYDTVKLPPYHATFGVILDSNSDDSVYLEALKFAFPQVQIAQKNGLNFLHIGANDQHYTDGNSAGLHPSISVPNADINIEPAWDLETGDSTIIVGIYDSGINMLHKDLSVPNAWWTSSVKYGYNYINNTSWNFSVNTDNMGHGSAIAGIIGAWRNSANNFGIAGIAGGDAGLKGVTFHDMKIFDATQYAPGLQCTPGATDNQIINAMKGGNGSVYVHDIQNHSWGFNAGGVKPLIREQFIKAYEAGKILCTSAGNGGLVNPNPCDAITWPASYRDHMIMKIGANDNTGGRADFSECDHNLDFIAPGTADLYFGLAHSGQTTFTDYLSFNGCNNIIDGTSFAAPHVTGLVALMLGYVKKNALNTKLSHEDCEQLIERSGPNYPNYDIYSGYGRINAGDVMSKLSFPQYRIQHEVFTVASNTADSTGFPFEYTCVELPLPNAPTVPVGNTQMVKRFAVTATHQHSIPSTYNLIGGWERGSGGNSIGIASGFNVGCAVLTNEKYVPAERDAVLDQFSLSATSATMTGYFYQFYFPGNTVAGWFPYDPFSTGALPVKFAYSLYLEEQIVGVEGDINDRLVLFPNPANETVNINLDGKNDQNPTITISDLTGKFHPVNCNNSNGTLSFNVDSFVSGIYFVTVWRENRSQVFKLIIQK